MTHFHLLLCLDQVNIDPPQMSTTIRGIGSFSLILWVLSESYRMFSVTPSLQVMIVCWYFLWDLEDHITVQSCLGCRQIPTLLES